ncbi:DegT/DnrJ/EryC1/StrS family aminotransferase, partial [bacterium]
MRSSFLPFALPDTDENEIEEIAEAIKAGWVTTGPKVHQFEAEFAAYLGAKHAIALNSGTAALHLSLEAVGIQDGDEVILPTLTFAATAEVVRYFNAKPVLVDANPGTLNMDVGQVEAAITPRTKAIIPVHLGGLPVDMDAVHAIAQKHGLYVVEDAAHALPTKYKGRMIGASSQSPNPSPIHSPSSVLRLPSSLTCFSFYATKSLTTGEGGMITTDNDQWAERCRIMGMHGISKDAWKRYTAEGSWYYEIIAPGFKYNMTDVAAAMGLAQLRKVEKMWARRKEIGARYTA